jgi:tRNA(Ile)-lysidine synthetase-like protein
MSPTISRIFSLVENVSAKLPVKDIIVMCSGGVDSVAALHYYHKKNLYNYRVNAYHFNHKLRPQNDVMYEKVKKMCVDFNIPLIYKSAADHSLKTEDQFRKARIEPLRKYANTINITGHHLDDCVESYLLNCFRGHQGYLPIPFYTFLEGTFSSYITHPFILTPKEKLKQYCIKHNLMQYIEEDETNTSSTGSRRNFIRNQIIPILEKERMGLQKVVKKIIEKRLLLECIKH